MKSIAELRKNYELGELNEGEASSDPFRLFAGWLDAALAKKLPEPTAMTLATVDDQCRPSTRIVLLKGYDESGLVWFTNYQSRKGRQLTGNRRRRCSSTGSKWSGWFGSKARCRRCLIGIRRVLPISAAAVADRRLGIGAEQRHRRPRRADRARRGVRPQVRAESAAPAALGRVSADA
jgi:hypothetical protein